MRKRRLLWQLYLSFLLITLASLLVVTWYASSALRQFYVDRTLADLKTRALLLERRVREGLAQQEYRQLDAECKQLGKEASTRITVLVPDGKVVADSEELPSVMENHADRPEVIEALAKGSGDAERYSYTLQENRMYVAIPVDHAGTTLGVLRTSISMSTFQQTLRTVQLRIAAVGLCAAVLVAVVSLLLSRRITRPLEELKNAAERFARGELTYKLPVANSLEIGSLAETMNQMAADLNDRIGNIVEQRNERDAILGSMVEGVVAVDTQERVIRMNQAAARLIGVDHAAAEGRNLEEIIRNPDIQRLAVRVLASQEPREHEIALHVNGERYGERYLQVQGTTIRDARDEPLGALLVLHDVTRLKRLEMVRRDFVANVSHELRTPVTSIKGFVETLLDGAMHNPDELQRFLRIVASQTDRLTAILEDLLTLSRVEQEENGAEIVFSPGPVKNVLDAAVEVCQMKASEKNIHVEITCDGFLQVPMNAPLLEQAVINLIDNAIKYSDPGQTVHVTATGSNGEVVIEIRDQGCGISREHLPRVFERFYRVDKARSRKLGGTGLGLAIVKHIAQAHNGRATVESSVGHGSTFSIRLPRP